MGPEFSWPARPRAHYASPAQRGPRRESVSERSTHPACETAEPTIHYFLVITSWKGAPSVVAMARSRRTGSFRASKCPRRKGAVVKGAQKTMMVYEGQSRERREEVHRTAVTASPTAARAVAATAAAEAAAAAPQPRADATSEAEYLQQLRWHKRKQAAAEQAANSAPPELGPTGASFLQALREGT